MNNSFLTIASLPPYIVQNKPNYTKILKRHEKVPTRNADSILSKTHFCGAHDVEFPWLKTNISFIIIINPIITKTNPTRKNHE